MLLKRHSQDENGRFHHGYFVTIVIFSLFRKKIFRKRSNV